MKFIVLFAAVLAYANAGVILKDTLVQTPLSTTDVVGPSGSIHKEELGTVALRTAIPTAPIVAPLPAPIVAPFPAIRTVSPFVNYAPSVFRTVSLPHAYAVHGYPYVL